MTLHDTRTGARVDPVAGRTVRLYVCGITPYDSAHLGHAFVYSAFDVLVRYLEHQGLVVRYARNVTDVDDDILRTAKARGVPYLQLAESEVAQFDAQLARLGLRAPDVAPRATGAIPAIVHAVAGLVERGAAYALEDGRVYFDTGAAPAGEFSGLDRAERERQFAEKGGDPDASGKRDALDFLLWQPSAPDEPAWDSPWGQGRPGWHIECSVMAMEHLGGALDVHGGGSDLVYPHHEAEVLQSEALTGQRPFARVWAHCGMVALDGTKMSKSLGNLVFLRDVLDAHDAAAVRRHLLENHYRSGWTHDEEALEQAGKAVQRWRDAGTSGADGAAEAAFHAAMRDDLDTPTALAAIDRAAEAGAGATVGALAGILGISLDGESARPPGIGRGPR